MHSQGNLPIYNNRLDPIPYYMAAIEAMDFQIGKLLDNIPEDERKNTIIIFIDIYINTKEKLENAVFELYDIVGKKILSQQIQASQPIDIQKLVPALYLYKIKQGLTTLKSGKIIKQ